MNEASTRANDFTVQLQSHEKLQIHMDCLNALGEIVNVDDVDDMGGVVSKTKLLLHFVLQILNNLIYSFSVGHIFVPQFMESKLVLRH